MAAEEDDGLRREVRRLKELLMEERDKRRALEERVDGGAAVDTAPTEEASVQDFLNLGLTRRQAFEAVLLVGAGYSISSAAIGAMTGEARAATGGWGTDSTALQDINVIDLKGESSEIRVKQAAGHTRLQAHSGIPVQIQDIVGGRTAYEYTPNLTEANALHDFKGVPLDITQIENGGSAITIADDLEDETGSTWYDESANALAIDKIASGGAVTSTDIDNLEGPGIFVDGNNDLSNDPEIPSDVSGSRSLGTWETNTTGNPIEVVPVIRVVSGSLSDGDMLTVAADVNSTQTANGAGGTQSAQGDGASNLFVSPSFVVPNGGEYRVRIVTDDSGSAALNAWFESQWGV